MTKDVQRHIDALTPVRRDEAREFWEAVFAAVVGANGTVETAVELADSSLKMWLGRWGGD